MGFLSIATAIFSFVVDAFTVAGVALPYYRPAKRMLEQRSVEGFSPYTSLVIVVSCTLRIFFWLTKRFEITLLIQAFVAVFSQVAVMAVITRVKAMDRRVSSRHLKRFVDFDLQHFWAWDEISSYLQFLGSLTFLFLFLHVSVGDQEWYSQLIGTMALFIEATLPVPQAITNWRNKSTRGVEPVMILLWVLGDAFKTAYAYAKQTPWQFLACGFFQLSADMVIVFQMLVSYREGGAGGGSSSSSSKAHYSPLNSAVVPNTAALEGAGAGSPDSTGSSGTLSSSSSSKREHGSGASSSIHRARSSSGGNSSALSAHEEAQQQKSLLLAEKRGMPGGVARSAGNGLAASHHHQHSLPSKLV